MQLTQTQRVSGNFLKLIRKSSNQVTVISKIIRVEFSRVGNVFVAHGTQESPRQTKPKKGPKRKVHEFRWILVFFLRKTSTIHILNFYSGMPLRNVHEQAFLWFGVPGPLLMLYRSTTWSEQTRWHELAEPDVLQSEQGSLHASRP